MACSNCKSAETELLCRKCEANYCSECDEVVHAIPILKTHASVRIDQKPRRMGISCTQHADEKLKFWCNTCSISVCSDCMVYQHQGHSCNGIENEAVNKAKEVRIEFDFQDFDLFI